MSVNSDLRGPPIVGGNESPLDADFCTFRISTRAHTSRLSLALNAPHETPNVVAAETFVDCNLIVGKGLDRRAGSSDVVSTYRLQVALVVGIHPKKCQELECKQWERVYSFLERKSQCTVVALSLLTNVIVCFCSTCTSERSGLRLRTRLRRQTC